MIIIFTLFIKVDSKPKKYIIVEIQEKELNYLILLEDKYNKKMFLIESLKPEIESNSCERIKKGDVIDLLLKKIKREKFKMSQDISSFDDLKQTQLVKIDTNHYCSELKGLFLCK